jgi:hypothetical protein
MKCHFLVWGLIMRRLITNAQDTFRVKAYAGTNGVLLAFDLAEERKPGFLGFAIEQKESGKPWQWLLNPEMDGLLLMNKNKSIEEWPAEPRDWLENGLLKKIITYIERAKGGVGHLVYGLVSTHLIAFGLIDGVAEAAKL